MDTRFPLERPRPPVGRRSPARVCEKEPGSLRQTGVPRNALIHQKGGAWVAHRICEVERGAPLEVELRGFVRSGLGMQTERAGGHDREQNMMGKKESPLIADTKIKKQ